MPAARPSSDKRLPQTQRDRRTRLASCPFADPSMTLHHYQVKQIRHQNASRFPKWDFAKPAEKRLNLAQAVLVFGFYPDLA